MKRVWVLGFLVGCGTIEAKNPDAKVTDAPGIDSPAHQRRHGR
jgi:hypothetical protein